MATEKERKFLLKDAPNIEWTKQLYITQFYHDGWRYRATDDVSIAAEDENETVYERLKRLRWQ